MHQFCSARLPSLSPPSTICTSNLYGNNFFQTFPCVSYVSSFRLVLKSQPTKTRSCKMFLFSIFLYVNFPKRPLHLKKENYKVRYIKGCQIHHEYCNKPIHLIFVSFFPLIQFGWGKVLALNSHIDKIQKCKQYARWKIHFHVLKHMKGGY